MKVLSAEIHDFLRFRNSQLCMHASRGSGSSLFSAQTVIHKGTIGYGRVSLWFQQQRMCTQGLPKGVVKEVSLMLRGSPRVICQSQLGWLINHHGSYPVWDGVSSRGRWHKRSGVCFLTLTVPFLLFEDIRCTPLSQVETQERYVTLPCCPFPPLNTSGIITHHHTSPA